MPPPHVWKICKDSRILRTNAANSYDFSRLSTNFSTNVKIQILVSEHTPIDLLGRDTLCKMNLQIRCSLDGVYIDSKGITDAQIPGVQKRETEFHCRMIYDRL